MSAGPYSAQFGAIHHVDSPGFLFTISPATAADAVADALNVAHHAAQPDRPQGIPRLLGYVLPDAPADVADGYPRQVFRELFRLEGVAVYVFDPAP